MLRGLLGTTQRITADGAYAVATVELLDLTKVLQPAADRPTDASRSTVSPETASLRLRTQRIAGEGQQHLAATASGAHPCGPLGPHLGETAPEALPWPPEELDVREQRAQQGQQRDQQQAHQQQEREPQRKQGEQQQQQQQQQQQKQHNAQQWVDQEEPQQQLHATRCLTHHTPGSPTDGPGAFVGAAQDMPPAVSQHQDTAPAPDGHASPRAAGREASVTRGVTGGGLSSWCPRDYEVDDSGDITGDVISSGPGDAEREPMRRVSDDGGGGGDQGSAAAREEACFRAWINSLGVPTRCRSLYGSEVCSGWLLLEVLDTLQPGCIPWPRANRPPFRASASLPLSLENCDLALGVAREVLGLQIVSITASDIVAGGRKPILSLIYQLMRFHVLQVLESLGTQEDGEADAAEAAEAAAAEAEGDPAGGATPAPAADAVAAPDTPVRDARPPGLCAPWCCGSGGSSDGDGGDGEGAEVASARMCDGCGRPPRSGGSPGLCGDDGAPRRAPAMAPGDPAGACPAAARAASDPGPGGVRRVVRGDVIVYGSSSSKQRRALSVTEQDVLTWINRKLLELHELRQGQGQEQGQGQQQEQQGQQQEQTEKANGHARDQPASPSAPPLPRPHLVQSFRDPSLGSGVALLEVLAAVAPGAVDLSLVAPSAVPCGRGANTNANANARYALEVAQRIGVPVFLVPGNITEVHPRLLLVLFASLMAYERKRTQRAAARRQEQH